MNEIKEIGDFTSSLPVKLQLEVYMSILQEIGGSIHHCERVANERWLPSAFEEQKRYEKKANEIKEKIRNIFNSFEN